MEDKIVVPIYLIIATHNRKALLKRTLESLSKCFIPENFKAAVIAENGGKSGAEDAGRLYSGELPVIYSYTDIGNKSLALNSAMKTLEEGLYIFTDDDVRFDNNFLAEYAKVAHDYSPGTFFGGAVEIDYEKKPSDRLLPFLPDSVKGFNPAKAGEDVDSAKFLGCNWAAFSKDIEAMGGFDSRFGPGAVSGGTGQESTMMRRLIETGRDGVFIPNAEVWHYVPKDRCSKSWLLNRAYRVAVSQGIHMKNDKTLKIMGLPVKPIESIIYYYYASIRNFRNYTPEAGLRAIINIRKAKGIYKGYFKS